MITGYYHTAFVVSDLDKSVEFYRDILGLKLSSVKEVEGEQLSKVVGHAGAKVRIGSISFGTHEIELIQYVAPVGDTLPAVKSNTIGSAHVAFFVDDADSMYRQLCQKGVRFSSAPKDFGAAKSCYFTDPDGIILEILERKAPALPINA